MINIAIHTWWIDKDATIHISVTIQVCLKSRMLTNAKRFIYVGNSSKTPIEAIGLYKLYLEFSSYLDLDNTYYVSSFRQNLSFISRSDK